MKDPVVNEALRQIQEIVAQETGNALAGTAKTRVQRVLSSALGQLAGVRGEDKHLTRDVTILLADLRGFTTISATYPAVIVLELLNRCFVRMSEIIFQHHGGIDKFMGDSILVIFESDPANGNESVKRALHCAVDMQLAMEDLNQHHRDEGWPEMYFGIGINTGRVMAALLGSDLYSEHTVIGDEVNLASRIESFSLRGQVLISQSTYERCENFIKCGDPMDVFVKGKSKLVVLREVLGIPSVGKEVPRQEVRRSPRVDVMLPMYFRMVENEVVVPEAYEGRVLDIGYHGVLAEISRPISQFSELVLEFDLPLVGKRLRDLYGKVVKVLPHAANTRVGIEFSTLSAENKAIIQLFVQLLIQGTESRD
ncbi:MAG TPA: adenylate/guanylate cyclase domain-containing protein [Usitatibacter sp.]|nr:adenylate/guanylate cyclase domain-containing protein [Usitatibacter sp.]